MKDPGFREGELVRVLSWQELAERMNPDFINDTNRYYGIPDDEYNRCNARGNYTVQAAGEASVELIHSSYYWPIEAVMHADEYEQIFGNPHGLPDPDPIDLSAWLST